MDMVVGYFRSFQFYLSKEFHFEHFLKRKPLCGVQHRPFKGPLEGRTKKSVKSIKSVFKSVRWKRLYSVFSFATWQHQGSRINPEFEFGCTKDNRRRSSWISKECDKRDEQKIEQIGVQLRGMAESQLSVFIQFLCVVLMEVQFKVVLTSSFVCTTFFVFFFNYYSQPVFYLTAHPHMYYRLLVWRSSPLNHGEYFW